MGDLINRQVALGEIKARFDDAREWYRTAKDEDIKARAEATIMSFTECSLMLKKLPSANTCENASEITRKSNAKDLISREGAIELFEKYSYPIEHDMGSVERGMTLYGIKQVLEELLSAELQDKCNGCFYLDSNGATCEFCARNYPDRYSAKTEGEKNDT